MAGAHRMHAWYSAGLMTLALLAHDASTHVSSAHCALFQVTVPRTGETGMLPSDFVTGYREGGDSSDDASDDASGDSCSGSEHEPAWYKMGGGDGLRWVAGYSLTWA